MNATDAGAFASAFEEAPVALAAVDESGRMHLMNRRFRSLVHAPRGPTEVSNLVAPGDRTTLLSALGSKTVAVEAVCEIELANGVASRWTLRRARGSRLITCLLEAGSRPHIEVGWHEALLSEAFMRDAPVGVVLCALDGTFLRVNRNFSELVGYAPGDLLGTRATRLSHVDDAGGDRAALDQLLLQQVAETRIEKRLVRRDGATVWASISLSLHRDHHGKVCGVLGVVQDIADRRRAEAELRDREARLEAIFNHATDSMVLFTAPSLGVDLQVLAVNAPFRRALARLGVSRDERLVGLTFAELARLSGATVAATNNHEARLRRAIDTGQSITEENETVTRSGPYFGTATATPIHDHQGRVVYVLACYRETTPQRLAEVQLQEALSAKDTLLREIHHRVKNNLQLVSSLLSLQQQDAGDARAREVLDLAKQRVHAVALIHESLYRSGSVGQLDFIAHAQTVVKQTPVGSTRVELLAANSLLLGMESAIPLGLILNELLTNALKHGNGARVVVRCDADELAVTLRVQDDGPGFPTHFQVENSSTLGLRIVSALAGQLGGSVQLEAGGGGRVCVSFPRPLDAAR